MTERSAASNSSDPVTAYRYDSAGNVIDNQENTNVYDNGYRLREETIITRGTTTKTTYGYDHSGNRETKAVDKDGTIEQWDYRYNDLNQLEEMDKPSGDTITFSYDTNGNRKTKSGPGNELLEYLYDHENRLISVHESGSSSSNESYHYGYDHRTRNVTRDEKGVKTDVVFLSGLSVVEYEGSNPWIIPDRTEPTVEYVRGSDWGGGIGGILYTTRDGQPSYNHYNGRGDVVAKTDDSGSLTYQATYEAYGTRVHEDGNNEDRQRANTKDESPWGGLNEGMRWRDLETGVWLTRDPAGFIDGPNLYAYVRQNPWTMFDPTGLAAGDEYRTRDDAAVQGSIDLALNLTAQWQKSNVVRNIYMKNKSGTGTVQEFQKSQGSTRRHEFASEIVSQKGNQNFTYLPGHTNNSEEGALPFNQTQLDRFKNAFGRDYTYEGVTHNHPESVIDPGARNLSTADTTQAKNSAREIYMVRREDEQIAITKYTPKNTEPRKGGDPSRSTKGIAPPLGRHHIIISKIIGLYQSMNITKLKTRVTFLYKRRIGIQTS